MVEPRTEFAYRTREDRRHRTWPKIPIDTLLQRWLKRIAKRSSKLPRPLRLEIRQKYATALGLPTRWVELRLDGTLWHITKNGDLWLANGTVPLATLPK